MGVRRHLTYANLMATLAVVIAIGGGIAIAGGKKDKGEPAGVWQGSAELDAGETKALLNVPGLGKFTASRGASGPSGGVTFKNTSGTPLRIAYLSGNVNGSPGDNTFAAREDLAAGESTFFGATSTYLVFEMIMSPVNASKKGPIADVSLHTVSSEHRVIVTMPRD